MDDLKRVFTFIGEDEQPVMIRVIYGVGIVGVGFIIGFILVTVLGA